MKIWRYDASKYDEPPHESVWRIAGNDHDPTRDDANDGPWHDVSGGEEWSQTWWNEPGKNAGTPKDDERTHGHMERMEQRLKNIEELLRELVELQSKN
jgi:hypothetical protein